MPVDPLDKAFAVRLTIGDQVTWPGGDDALMDYETAKALFFTLSREHVTLTSQVTAEVAIVRRGPKRWIKTLVAKVTVPKRRRRALAA